MDKRCIFYVNLGNKKYALSTKFVMLKESLTLIYEGKNQSVTVNKQQKSAILKTHL